MQTSSFSSARQQNDRKNEQRMSQTLGPSSTADKAYSARHEIPIHESRTFVAMIIENTSLMQQDKYIFHLHVFSTCFGRDITHHQELQNCTHSDMVMVPREVRRDVEEIKWRLARQYYARVGYVKRVERSLVSSLVYVHSSVTPDDG